MSTIPDLHTRKLPYTIVAWGLQTSAQFTLGLVPILVWFSKGYHYCDHFGAANDNFPVY